LNVNSSSSGWIIFLTIVIILALLGAGFLAYKKYYKGKNGD